MNSGETNICNRYKTRSSSYVKRDMIQALQGVVYDCLLENRRKEELEEFILSF